MKLINYRGRMSIINHYKKHISVIIVIYKEFYGVKWNLNNIEKHLNYCVY